MPLDYPSNTIWYVQGLNTAGDVVTEGSAVAIRLQKRLPKEEARNRDPEAEAKTYLLTCSHVVRSDATNGDQGCGTLLHQLVAWPPEKGFTPDQCRQVTVNHAIRPIPFGELSKSARGAAEDWVVLDVADQYASNALASWKQETPSGPFAIHGFVGGKASFRENSIVRPTRMPIAFPLFEKSPGHLCLTGGGTRPGISGGGVFSEDDLSFAGIHRARFDTAQQLYAVSAEHILQRLDEKGYVPVQCRIAAPGSITELRESLASLDPIVPALAAYRNVITGIRAKVIPKTSTDEPPSHADNESWLRAVLDELGALSKNSRGLYPLFDLIFRATKHRVIRGALKDRLRDWLDNSCPAEQRDALTAEPENTAGGEPRIVIQMKPEKKAEPDLRAERTDGPRFTFTLYYEGFPTAIAREDHCQPRDELKSILKAALDQLRNLYSIGTPHALVDPSVIWVELVVPKQMLTWAVESLSVPVKKILPPVLGVDFNFVLRSERVESWVDWDKRWRDAHRLAELRSKSICLECHQPLGEVPTTAQDECHFFVAIDGAGGLDPENLFYELLDKTSVLGVAYPTPPLLTNDGEVDAWDAVLDSGVPLLVWLRESPDQWVEQPGLSHLFQKQTWDAVPDVIRSIRRSSVGKKNARHIGRFLAVLFDDPRRELPWMSEAGQLVSPAATQ